MSSSSALPPPGNLPSWSRVSALDRSRYPKPFLRDRLPLPPGGGTTITTDAMVDFNNSLGNVDVKFLDEVSPSEQHRLIYYNKSIKFLQQQHSETLKKLHEELDLLKRENKELQFKIILSQNNNSIDAESTAGVRKPSSAYESDKLKMLHFQEEARGLKQALKESNARNKEMQKTLQTLLNQRENETKLNQRVTIESPGRESIGDSEKVARHRRKFSVSNLSSPLPLNATLNPLQIRDGTDSTPRIPSISECEVIIQQLHKTNCQQLADLSQLRTEKKEANDSRTPTPEQFSYRTFGPADNESFSDTRLPRIPVKPIIKKSIASASSTERTVTLPALKNSISSNVADRRKRQQAMQKARSKKEYQ